MEILEDKYKFCNSVLTASQSHDFYNPNNPDLNFYNPNQPKLNLYNPNQPDLSSR